MSSLTLGKRIIYTTPKADVTTNYRAVAEYYGDRASIIDIGPRGHNINPLQVFYDENVMVDAQSYQRAFDEHMEILDQFFAVLFQDTKSPNQTSYMNRPTDINLSADFIIIDISDVPASLQDAMNVFVTGIMGQRFKTDARKETIIAVDEAAVFLRNPKLSQFLLRTLTQGRSYNISLWLATQQTVDLVKAGVEEEFKTNMQISIVLGNMRKDTIEHVKAFYKLDEHSTSDLMTCGVGEGLLIVGSEVIPTRLKSTDHEFAVIKGKHHGTIANEKVAEESMLLLVHPGLKDLINEHQIYFPDWLQPGHDISLLSQEGYKQYRAQKLDGNPGFVWLPQKNVIGNMVGNESIDHYSIVLQRGSELISKLEELKKLNERKVDK